MTIADVVVTVEELRKKYPEPKSERWNAPGDYCVGGALCQEMALVITEASCFPTRPQLARRLCEVNSALSSHQAAAIATRITRANTAGDFDGAWEWLARGLEGRETR